MPRAVVTPTLTINAANTVVNRYAALTGDAAAGATSLTVASTAALNLQPGDLLMVIQMQGAAIDTQNNRTYGTVTSLNNAGRYELVRVVNVQSATVINVTSSCGGLRFSYTAAGHAQVIYVPEANVLNVQAGASIVAPAWNGATGGVVAVNVLSQSTIDGSIRVDAAGFRGGAIDDVTSTPGYTGAVSTRNQDGAEKGESIAGYQAEYDTLGGRYGRGAPANGGGGGNSHNAGGGGGANAWSPTLGNWNGQGNMDTAPANWLRAWALDPAYIENNNQPTTSAGGGRGGYTFSANNQDAFTVAPADARWGGDSRRATGGFGGRPLDVNAEDRIFLGGGGGAGDRNNTSGTRGGNGGGIIYLQSPQVSGSGMMSAQGENGPNTVNTHNDAPGGGGGGGTIIVRTTSPITGITLRTDGGTGGTQLITSNEGEGPGGGGGGGFIAISQGTPTRSALGGAYGTTRSASLTEFIANGATSGAAGISDALVGPPVDVGTCTNIDLFIAGLDNGTTALSPGQTTTYTFDVVNNGAAVPGATVAASLSHLIDVTWTCVSVDGVSQCPASGTTFLNTLVNLAANGRLRFTLNGRIDSATTANSQTTTVMVSPPGGYGDTDLANNRQSDTDTLSSEADLSVTVSHTPAGDVRESTAYAYIVDVRNAGPSAAIGTSVSTTLPAGVTYQSFVGNGWTCAAAGQVITCTRVLGNLEPDIQVPITLNVTAPAIAVGGADLTVTTTATVTATTTDPQAGNNTGSDRHIIINVDGPNDPPINTVPAVVTTGEDSPLVFNGTNTLSYADSDDAGAVEELTLTVNFGTLQLGSTQNITITAGADGTSTVTLRGTETALNAAVAGLIYIPPPQFNGTASLVFTSNDLGNTGTGGARTDSDAVVIDVGAVNDPPSNTHLATIAANEDTPIVFSGANAITIADSDAGAGSVTVTLSAPAGVYSPGSTLPPGLIVLGAGTGTLVLTGTLADINTALDGATFTPPAETTGDIILTISTDDQGNTGTGGPQVTNTAITATFAPVNDPPTIAGPAGYLGDEDVALGLGSLQVADIDAAGGNLMVVLSVGQGTLAVPSGPGVAVTGSGTSTLTLVGSQSAINAVLAGGGYRGRLNYNGNDTLTVTVSDLGNTGAGGPQSANAALPIVLRPMNDNPIASNDTFGVTNDQGQPVTIAVLSNDGDTDNDPLTITGVTQPPAGQGSVAIAGGQIAYTPPSPTFAGTVTFTYTISDGQGGTDTATVTLDVSPAPNQPPVNTVPGAQSVNEDAGLPFTVSVSDPDAGSAVVEVAIGADRGRLTLATTAGLTFLAGDGQSDPVIVVRGTLAALNAALQTVTFTPDANYNGPAVVTVISNDLGNTGAGGPRSDTDQFTVTVNPVNDPPTARNDTFVIANNGNPVNLPVLANDTGAPDSGETLTITDVTQPPAGQGTIAIVGGELVYTPPSATFAGIVTVTYTVSDGNGGTTTATVTIDLRPQGENIGPTNGVPLAQATLEDTPLVFSAAGSNLLSVADPDAGGQVIEFTLSAEHGLITLGSLTNLTFSTGDGTQDALIVARGTLTDLNAALAGLTFTPEPNYFGPAALRILSNDLGNTGTGGARTDFDTVAIDVRSVNDAPVANDDAVAIENTGGAVSIDVLANDTSAPDPAEILTITGVTQGASGTVTINGSQVTYVPNPGFAGTDTFTYTISDGNGGTDTATVTVTVGTPSANDAPTNLVPANQTTPEDMPLVFSTGTYNDLSITDPDAAGGNLTVTLNVPVGTLTLGQLPAGLQVSGNGTGQVTLTGTQADINAALQGLTFAPPANFNGPVILTITTNDQGNSGPGGPQSDSDQITINVTPVNDPPTAANDTGAFTPGQSVTINVLANDTDPDTGDMLSVLGFTQPANGTVVLNSAGQLVYTPNGNFTGTDTFTYTVTDTSGATSTATVTVGPSGPVDSDGDGLTDDVERGLGTDPNDPDSDNDGLNDGVEVNTTRTNPRDDDSDDDGILDGNEDRNGNGILEPGETDPNDRDSDDDGVQDGTEIGLTQPQGQNTNGSVFVPDANPSTTTNPRDPDSDDDGLTDGQEDENGNGRVDGGETNPRDADTDDGGVNDGDEVNRDDTDPLDPRDDTRLSLAGGGFSCDVGGAGGVGGGARTAGWPMLLGLGLLGLMLLRRRYFFHRAGRTESSSRRLQASLMSRRGARGLWFALVLLPLVWPGTARAQNGPGFQINRYEPTPAGEWSFLVEHPWFSRTRPIAVGVTLNYGNNPLVFGRGDPNGEFTQLQAVIAHQFLLHFDIAGSLGDRLTLSASLPITLLERGRPAEGVSPLSGATVGDPRFGAVIRLYGQPDATPFSVSVGGDIWVPIGLGNNQGDVGTRFRPKLLFGGYGHRVQWSVTGAFYYRPQATIGVGSRYPGNSVGPAVQVGAAIAYFDPVRRFHIGPEALYSGTVIGGDARRGYTSLEVLLGGLYNIGRQVLIGAAGGIGLLREPGTPDFRFLFRLAYAPINQDRDRDGVPDTRDRCPGDPEDKDQFQDSDGCPDPDNDQDGIPDTKDKCPNEAEDKDGFEDEDGCPEPDNDKDGVADLQDSCPTEPEDKDGFKDDDGCPDPDNDKDGIPDLKDACPSEPEDKDGFKDDDGCPEPDNDKDGIPDAQDKCPNEAGAATLEGCPDRDQDGVADRVDNCPDEPGPASNHGCKDRQLARLRDGRIDIIDSVYFKTDEDVIENRSYPLLDNVARILQSHPDLRVRVEGHTDNQGSLEHNKELSRRRAQAVVRFLAGRGVDAKRLEAEGYGPIKPIADNSTKQGRAKNRRVVFTVIGDASGIRQEDAGPGTDTIDR